MFPSPHKSLIYFMLDRWTMALSFIWSWLLFHVIQTDGWAKTISRKWLKAAESCRSRLTAFAALQFTKNKTFTCKITVNKLELNKLSRTINEIAFLMKADRRKPQTACSRSLSSYDKFPSRCLTSTHWVSLYKSIQNELTHSSLSAGHFPKTVTQRPLPGWRARNMAFKVP